MKMRFFHRAVGVGQHEYALSYRLCPGDIKIIVGKEAIKFLNDRVSFVKRSILYVIVVYATYDKTLTV